MSNVRVGLDIKISSLPPESKLRQWLSHTMAKLIQICSEEFRMVLKHLIFHQSEINSFTINGKWIAYTQKFDRDKRVFKSKVNYRSLLIHGIFVLITPLITTMLFPLFTLFGIIYRNNSIYSLFCRHGFLWTGAWMKEGYLTNL